MTRKSLPVWLSEEHHGPNHHILTYKTETLAEHRDERRKHSNGRVKKKAHRTRGKEKGGQGGVSVTAPNAQLRTTVLTNCH